MKQIVRRHFGTFDGEEIYELKLKDKPDQSAFRIQMIDKATAKPIILKEIQIIKVPKMNNRFILKLKKEV